MKTLILLRHAKSSWDSLSKKDIDRPLNERGVADSAKIGKWITANYPPDMAIISDAKRTRQTFDHSALSCSHEFLPSLYLADQRQLLSAIQATPNDTSTLMLVGHNPGITDLVNFFLNSSEGYLDLKTANCAVFEFNTSSWEKVSRKNAELIDFASGKKLK